MKVENSLLKKSTLFAVLVAFTPHLVFAQRTKPPTLDFTKGDVPDKTHDWTLGATARRNRSP